MPRDVRVLQIVVASPSDVKAERDALEDVIKELNGGVAKSRGLILSISRWEEDAYAGFNINGPQGLIDAILKIDECDIFIGIFWKKFGTPVKDAKSGTEHEFKIAFEAWQKKGSPNIMFYFSQKPYAPQSKKEADQWGQVLEFKDNFPKEGLWWPYEDEDKFPDLTRKQLTNLILSPQINSTQSPPESSAVANTRNPNPQVREQIPLTAEPSAEANTRTPAPQENEPQRLKFEDIQAAMDFVSKQFPGLSLKETLEMVDKILSLGKASGDDKATTGPQTRH